MVQLFPALNPVENPTCSVCIANYNGVDVLADCIDSVLAQTGNVPVEIIIHDDASTDGSVEWIRRRYPNVEVLASACNAGFCVANNRMAERARGEFILLLNNDAALRDDALQILAGAARERPVCSILTLPQYDWASEALVDFGCLLDPLNVPTPNRDPDRSVVAFVIGACLWIPRDAWRALGGFPEWLESIGEDLYLCCAARLRGWQVRCLPASGYRHRQGASFGGNRMDADGIRTRYRRRYLSERNRLAVFVACTPTVLMWPWLALQVAVLLLEGGLLSLALRSARPWREIYAAALRDAWRGRQATLSLRRSLQTQRVCTLLDYLRAFSPWPRKLAVLLRKGLPGLS